MGTPPLPQGALPPAPCQPPWARPCRPPALRQHPRCHGSWRDLGERSHRCDPSRRMPVLRCRAGVLERRLCSPSALPWEGRRGERPPTMQLPASAARSWILTKWKYFSVSKSFTVKKRERERETRRLSRVTQTETCFCRRPPHQEAFRFPQEPQHQAGVPTPSDLSILICFGVVYCLLGHTASTSGRTLRRT